MPKRKHKAGDPCPQCIEARWDGHIHRQAVQPLRGPGRDAMSITDRSAICRDCEAAENLVKLDILGEFMMARTATGNCRMEQMRLPGAPLGLVLAGYMKPSEEGELERHLEWLDEHEKEIP